MGEWKSTCMHAHTQSHANRNTLRHPNPSGQTMADFVTQWLDKKPPRLQALVYDILPSATALFSYAIGSRKLSANEPGFFVGAQTVVSYKQPITIISDICFIADHVAYASSNKTKIVWIERELFFFSFTRGGCVSFLRACLGARLPLQSY